MVTINRSDCVTKAIYHFAARGSIIIIIAAGPMGMIAIMGGYPFHPTTGYYTAGIYAVAIGVVVTILREMVSSIKSIGKCHEVEKQKG